MKKTQRNPKSLANLKKWQPGQSGNPSGRPHKRPISDRYAEIVEKVLPDDVRNALGLRKGATYGEAIALGQARQAIKGKPEAAREIREAIEGRSAPREEDNGVPKITTVIIDSRNRPDWRAMREQYRAIDVPSLPGSPPAPKLGDAADGEIQGGDPQTSPTREVEARGGKT